MIEQINNGITFFAFFAEAKLGKAGLTVTVNVRNPAGTLIVTGGSATEVGDGLYRYTLAFGSVTSEGEYTAVFKTATTSVDQRDVPALWSVGRAGVEHLDAPVSSRATDAGVWAHASRTLSDFDFQVTVASNLDKAGYALATAPPTAVQIRQEIDANSTMLDVPVSSRLDASAYLAPPSPADLWGHAERSLTDKAGYELAASGLDAVEIEAGIQARQALAIVLASAAGVLSGAATSEVTIRGGGTLTPRIVAQVDADGNRTAVTLSLPT